MTDKLTKSQRGAFKWLLEHNGTGVFDKHGVLLAGGELGPFERRTWNKLRDAGLIEYIKPNKKGGAIRVNVKPTGEL